VLCALEVVKINILGVCCAKGSVFREGFKVSSLVVLCVICIWLLSGLPNGFWGLDVALSLRVNQYKLFVYLFLPSNSFKFSCYCFASINNRLFRRNNRFFFLVLCCFVLYILTNWISDWISYKGFCSSLKSFKKPPFKQFTPLSFKAIYSNIFDPRLCHNNTMVWHYSRLCILIIGWPIKEPLFRNKKSIQSAFSCAIWFRI